MDSERRVEEDLAQDSQDLSSAASLDRDSGSSNEESGLARRRPQRRRPRKQEPEANGRPIVVENSGPGSRLYSTISSKEGTPSDAVPAAAKVGPAAAATVAAAAATAAVTVVPAAAGGNASSTGPSQPREQRNRVLGVAETGEIEENVRIVTVLRASGDGRHAEDFDVDSAIASWILNDVWKKIWHRTVRTCRVQLVLIEIPDRATKSRALLVAVHSVAVRGSRNLKPTVDLLL